ncbi:MAG: hypothetical protein Q9178_006241 [Gyalolechia marmorata]
MSGFDPNVFRGTINQTTRELGPTLTLSHMANGNVDTRRAFGGPDLTHNQRQQDFLYDLNHRLGAE